MLEKYIKNNKIITLVGLKDNRNKDRKEIIKGLKKPLEKEWQKSEFRSLNELNEIKSKYYPTSCNYSMVLTENDLIIDIDVSIDLDTGIKKQGEESYKQLLLDLNLSETELPRTVKTASGGSHIYLKTNEKLNNVRNIGKYPNIDFLSKGSCVIIPPSFIIDNSYELLDEKALHSPTIAPQILLDLLQDKNKTYDKDNWVNQSELSLSDKAIMYHRNHTTDKDILLWLSQVDPSDNDIWLQTIMCLHSHFYPDRDQEGLEIMLEWSKNTSLDNYNEETNITRWRSLDANSQGQNGRNRYTLTHLKKNLAKIKDWYDNWFYLDHRKMFIKGGEPLGSKLSREGLEEKFYRVLPVNEDGYKVAGGSVYRFIKYKGEIEVATQEGYFPHIDDNVVEIEGITFFNTYSRNHIPKPAPKDNLETVEIFKNHIYYLCNRNEEYTNTLINWFAYQTQYRGKILGYMPVITSIKGLGKSVFIKLFKNMYGESNVGTVDNKNVKSNFTSWATGSHIKVFDELKIHGENRYDVVNTLKPYITDNTILVTKKGQDPVSIPNTTNYIVFSNFTDCLPMEKNERRYYLINAEYNSKQDFIDIINKHQGTTMTFYEYTGKLQHTFENKERALEILKYLTEFEIDPNFLKERNAPHTIYKDNMVENEKPEEALIIQDFIRDNSCNKYNEDYVLTAELFEAVRFDNHDMNKLHSYHKKKILTSLDYKPSFELRLNNKTHTIYQKGNLTKEEIKTRYYENQTN
ncbi:hypothetical protein AB832_07610 [Flavobacteriaceae bacterium (ex Bugula neritina AB1)]|nr:hypothetical protein AB832_07610 [Flavobacteriaceae bacterium (ex Bugula neritina AB1)]